MLSYFDPKKAMLMALTLLVMAVVLMSIVPAEAGVHVVPKVTEKNLLFCASEDMAKDVSYLLEKGVDPNATGDFGYNALILAAQRGNDKVIEVLVKAERIEIDKQDASGYTAVMYAAMSGHTESVRILAENDADLTIGENHYGSTALGLSVQLNHLSTAKLLLEKGADINYKDNQGWTALKTAAYYGYDDAVKYLIAEGADVNLSSNEGETPLMGAAWHGHINIMIMLIRVGADINARSQPFGRTALIHAVIANNVLAADILLTYGADANCQEDNGNIAGDYIWSDKMEELFTRKQM
ncbi:ankyrin repeat domain-containing protein [Patescibacteria group bacterium]|nr:ankyrin repeat domain-containing protein [Patescibacteria group bacterium]